MQDSGIDLMPTDCRKPGMLDLRVKSVTMRMMTAGFREII